MFAIFIVVLFSKTSQSRPVGINFNVQEHFKNQTRVTNKNKVYSKLMTDSTNPFLNILMYT